VSTPNFHLALNNSKADTFHHYFSDLAGYYQDTVKKMQAVYDNIPLPAPGIPFTALTFNMGEQSICRPHLDSQNLSFGQCLICPLGRFNHKTGGHLVAHEPRMILEMAPGSGGFIPSASVSHSNVAICAGETRLAMTGYTPASYFQHVEENFCPVPHRSCLEKNTLGQDRWDRGLRLLPQISNYLST
jgi:hypothetical protein